MLWLLVLACIQTAPPVDTAGDGGGADGGGVACDMQVVAQWPADGASDTWLQPTVQVDLSPADPTASLVLKDDQGVAVSATAAYLQEGATVQLQLAEPLAEGATYTVVADTCAGASQWSFTTVDAPGLPAELDSQAVSYRLDPRYGRLLSPAGLDLALAPLLPDGPWLLGVARTDAGLSLRLGASSGQTQDTCVRTQELPDASLDDTHLYLGPVTASLDLVPGALTLHDLRLQATFAHEGGELAGLELELVLDARDLAALGTLGADRGAVCASLAETDVSCGACADGVLACVSTRWDSITAPIQDGLSVQDIPSPDCHPDCAASWSNPACNASGW